MSGPGRNDPCPCGSNKKYKKCCQEQDQTRNVELRQHRSANRVALDWLREEYASEVQQAISLDFLGERSEEELDKILKLPRQVSELLHANMEDWLLCDAELMLDDEPKQALELIFGLKGPVLTPPGKAWLTALAEQALGLYQVVKGKPQELIIKDLLAPQTDPLRVTGAGSWNMSEPGEIFGARLVRYQNRLVFSGAYYPLFDEMATECLAAINEELALEQTTAWQRRKIISVVLIDFWLESLIQLVDDETDLNPNLL
jgi:hypothetical protein